jgi:hypothetical protein
MAQYVYLREGNMRLISRNMHKKHQENIRKLCFLRLEPIMNQPLESTSVSCLKIGTAGVVMVTWSPGMVR